MTLPELKQAAMKCLAEAFANPAPTPASAPSPVIIQAAVNVLTIRDDASGNDK